MQTFINIGIPIIVSVLLLGLIGVLSFRKQHMTTKEIALAAVTIAMSFGLSYIRLYKMPQGGSITLASTLPVMLFAYIFGFRKGLLVGIVYGWLQFIQEPVFLSPMQVLLDYVLGFASVALAGLLKEFKSLRKKHLYDLLCGILIAGIVRFTFSSISGVVYFHMYAGEMNVWIYSLGYNSVLLIDTAIALGVCAGLQYSPAFRRFVLYLDDGRHFGRRASAPRDTGPAAGSEADAAVVTAMESDVSIAP